MSRLSPEYKAINGRELGNLLFRTKSAETFSFAMASLARRELAKLMNEAKRNRRDHQPGRKFFILNTQKEREMSIWPGPAGEWKKSNCQMAENK